MRRPAATTTALAVTVAGTAVYLLAAQSAVLAWRIVPLVVALVGYAALLGLAHRGRTPSARAVATTAGVLLVLAVAVPPLHSRDVYLYAMQGRIVAVHRANPYVAEPNAFPDDPALGLVAEPFRDGGSAYGPAFTAVETAVAASSGGSPTAARIAFQGLAAAAVVASLFLVRRLGGGTAAMVFVGLNPALLAKGVNEGHVDVLLGLVVLGAVALARRRPVAAAAVLAVGALIKLFVLLPLAALLVWMLVHNGWRAAVKAGAFAGSLVVAGYAAVGGARALQPLREAALHQSRSSLWAQPRQLLTGELATDGVSGSQAGADARQVVGLLAVLLVAVLAVAVVGAVVQRSSPAPTVVAALLAYLLASVYVPAWYMAVALPVAGLVWRSRLAVAVAVHGAALALVYVYSPALADDPMASEVRFASTWVVPTAVAAAIAAILVASGRALRAQRPWARPPRIA